ncbi:hypothetical protein [Streptomyces liangshanensis]|uniref:hypothetical protein n=1 Tax=Streptomyces liangshanensis TaxID=2717324 RepID=UPI0036DBBD9A
MSVIIKFFTATDDTSAASSLVGGPHRDLAPVTCGNFDAMEAVVEWESLLTGRSFEALVASDEPRTVADPGDGGGPLLFAVSAALRGELAGASAARQAQIGALWVRERALEGDVFDPELVEDLLGELAALARAAGARGEGLYCWVA